MTYKWVKEQVLKLLNQYTISGSPVASSYNNQQDYLLRIPSLVNDAVYEIATTYKKIPKTISLSSLTGVEQGRMIRYTLPDDFYQFKTGSTVRTVEGELIHTNVYQLQDTNYMLVPKDEAGDYMITYYRRPALLSDSPSDTDVLDNTEDTHFVVPYHVASELIFFDNPQIAAEYRNLYDDRCNKLLPLLAAEIHTVEDVYTPCGGVWN